jgi:hypothetical protein
VLGFRQAADLHGDFFPRREWFGRKLKGLRDVQTGTVKSRNKRLQCNVIRYITVKCKAK